MNEAEGAPAVQQAHSREWYARLARELGGYRHPWRHEPDGPPPEGVFDVLLEDSLGLDVRVLEAGCGHGPDAARHAGRVAVWTAYDQFRNCWTWPGRTRQTHTSSSGTAVGRCQGRCWVRTT